VGTLNFRITTPLSIKRAQVAIIVNAYLDTKKSIGAKIQQVCHERIGFVATMVQQVQGQYRINDTQKQNTDYRHKKHRVVLVN